MIPLPNGENYFYVSSKGVVYSTMVLKEKKILQNIIIFAPENIYIIISSSVGYFS